MSYQLELVEHPTYVHATGSGDRTPDNMRRFLVEAYEAAVARGKTALILLDVQFAGPNLNLGCAYEVVSERIADAAKFQGIAYVDANYVHSPDGVEFAELAAKNLGVNVRLLRSVDEAKRWLDEYRAARASSDHRPGPVQGADVSKHG